MSTRHEGREGMTEACADCGRETIHRVHVELRTESSKSKNAAYSREPYRVSTCQECEQTTVRRMNNA